MNKVLSFDLKRIKPATNVDSEGMILSLPTMAAHDEDRDEVVSLACTALVQDSEANSADVLEGAMYTVMRARYAHVTDNNRADTLVASGVASLMEDGTIFDEVIERLMFVDLLSI